LLCIAFVIVRIPVDSHTRARCRLVAGTVEFRHGPSSFCHWPRCAAYPTSGSRRDSFRLSCRPDAASPLPTTFPRSRPKPALPVGGKRQAKMRGADMQRAQSLRTPWALSRPDHCRGGAMWSATASRLDSANMSGRAPKWPDTLLEGKHHRPNRLRKFVSASLGFPFPPRITPLIAQVGSLAPLMFRRSGLILRPT